MQVMLYIFLPVTTPVLLPDDHYILRHKIAISRVVRPVLHRVFLLLRPQNSKTIKELLLDLDGFSMARYRREFNASQRSKLDNDEPSEGFDVTLMYKLIQLLCELADTNDSKWSTPGSLEYNLKQLKEHRNTSVHEEVSFTFSDLQEKIKDMEELCRSVLITAGLRSRQPVTSDINKMEGDFEEVLLGGVDRWEPYKEALLKERNEQTAVLIREGRKDIQRLGMNLRILNPFSWLIDSCYSNLDVEHIFTDLLIEGKGRIEMHHLITSTLPSGKLPNVIIVSGPPGMGKTSLFRFLVHDWLSSHPVMLGMENTELIIPVELRHVFSPSVKDLLKDELLHGVSQQLKADDVMSALKNVSLLWLLDGYDEASISTRQVIKEIHKKFPNSRILITSRTEFINEIEIALNQVHGTYLTVKLGGFSKDNVEKCANRLISVSVADDGERDIKCQNFMDFCQKDNRIHWDIFHVPLFITIIVILWLNSPDKVSFVKSRTALYCLLIDHIVQRLIARDSFRKLNQRKSFHENKLKIFLDHLGQVLWSNSFYHEFTLKKYEVQYLEEKCSELDLPFTDTMSAFFVYAERATPSEIREEFTFIHRTLSDFLAARAFVNKMISENWDVMTTAMYYFKSRRKVLLQYDPNYISLSNWVGIETLSKEFPDDVFERIHDKNYFMSTNAFFSKKDHCPLHEHGNSNGTDYSFKSISDNGVQVLVGNNVWCFVKGNILGHWLIYLLGYLGAKKQFNESRRKQLVFILVRRDPFSLNFEEFPNLLEEACDPLFTKMMCTYIKNITWSFYEEYNFRGALKFLQYVVPNSVFIHYCYRESYSVSNNFDRLEVLTRTIEAFVKYPLDIHFDLHYFFCRDDKELRFTKNCLEMLLNESSSCRLVTVRCPVDNEVLLLLKKAVHLQELKIKFQGDDLSQLSDLIKTLPKLKVFVVALDPCNYYSQPGQPSLIEENRLLPKTSIILTDVFSLDLCEVGSSLKALCRYPRHVVLHGKVVSIDLENILALIFWVLRNVEHLPKLDIILDISEFNFLITQTYKIQIFKSFLKKVFANCDIRFKYDMCGSISEIKQRYIDGR
ncbi:uncharacterized protein [Palaemon carinicauda]|uniref:uncharacterized protein n=1 Tax=Palaemon carinicauda TaxID=392227 RepID=UPI0035B614CA